MKRKRHHQAPLSLFAFQDIITSVAGVFLLLTLFMALELTIRRTMPTEVASARVIEELQVAIVAAEERVTALRHAVDSRQDPDFVVAGYTQMSADAAVKAAREEVRLLRAKLEQLRGQRQELEELHARASTELANRATDRVRLEQLRDERVAVESELTELRNSQRVFYNASDERGRQVLLVELWANEILVAEAGKTQRPLQFEGTRRTRAFLNWAEGQPNASIRFVIIVHPGTTTTFQELYGALRASNFSLGFDLLPNDRSAVDPMHGAG